jgi:hypothetical protein
VGSSGSERACETMSDEFDAAMASAPGAEEEDDAPASMETFSEFGGAFGASGDGDDGGADEDDEDDDPAADVKAMQQALVNERVAHMDLLPPRCARPL